jgi:hypothetical protein
MPDIRGVEALLRVVRHLADMVELDLGLDREWLQTVLTEGFRENHYVDVPLPEPPPLAPVASLRCLGASRFVGFLMLLTSAAGNQVLAWLFGAGTLYLHS